ncbi:MAG: hypothetical protein NT167_22390, partial [Verrucomicrobia bacterium]|nr:hypothetical protein [Verrucomicrobiota bacterium]
MSETTKIELTPEAVRLLRDLAAMPTELPVKIARVMDYQNALTVSHIQRAYLSFPKGSPPVDIGCRVQSNRLRGGAWASAATATGDSQVTSSIGDNVKYAAIHEFGGDFTRKGGKVRLLTDASGTLLGQRKNARLAVFARTKKDVRKMDARYKEVAYGAHAVHYPERRPFRRGIADRIPNYGKAIS